ncbi:transcriptional regulator LuxR family [Pseudomonas sp. MT-1]|uniref:hypothetical protein n=1 Tax=Stutzerimonas stutzeri TaxID=316 RepID=UPI0005362463|nr:hypothetical protein [Stutzerimonas stutzeri]MCQ4282584.1 hypothetical protein [Stutzerimonas stutzeri]BAP80935.1 transcriptional regulator LuxR family [Pseudomonas sp. MT-1]
MTKLRISAFPEEVQIELELQAEAAGMSAEDYAAQLLKQAIDRLVSGDLTIDDFIDSDRKRKPVLH